MPELYAQPYNLDAIGFYFDCTEDFNDKSAANTDRFGMPVEEYEIQFIDGSELECELFKAFEVHQGNLSSYFNTINDTSEEEHIKLIALAESGYTIDENTNTQDVDLYYLDSFRDLAIQFVDEGLYGTVPEALQYYIDYDAMARDLGMEYSELRIDGQNIIYRCP